jgi:hypothetical protein
LREGWAAPGCERLATEGACVALACPTAIPSLSEAGALTATIGDAVLSATPEPSGLYLRIAAGLELVPGGPVEIRASGAEVPAFSGTVVAPGVMSATLPATARRDATWTIPWSSPGATHVQLLLAGGGTVVRCLTDASEASLDVAPEVLATLPAGSAVITLTALNRTEVAAGDFDVLLTVADALGGNIVLE